MYEYTGLRSGNYFPEGQVPLLAPPTMGSHTNTSLYNIHQWILQFISICVMYYFKILGYLLLTLRNYFEF